MPLTNHQAAAFLDLWNEPDVAVRAQTMADLLEPSCTYDDVHRADPAVGHEALNGFLTFFRERVPGVTNALEGDVEGARHFARFRFHLTKNGETFARGMYLVTLNEAGRMAAIYGFVD